MLLKELYESMYGKVKLNEDIPDDQMIDYVEDGEKKEMPAGSAKTMGQDHPAKIEYEKLKKGGGAATKSVNIFDEPPADEPADKPKGQPSGDDAKQIGGPNGLEIDRDDIARTLMNDPEIAAILGDEDDVYWDDVDLVSSKWDDVTVASIDPNSPETIGDLKQRIKDFEKEQGGSEEDSNDRKYGIPNEDLKDTILQDLNPSRDSDRDELGLPNNKEDWEREFEEVQAMAERAKIEYEQAEEDFDRAKEAGEDEDELDYLTDKAQDALQEYDKYAAIEAAYEDKENELFSDADDEEDRQYQIDDLRNEIEDLTMQIEEYDEAIADAKREYEEALEMGDDDEAEYARDMMDDMRAEKNGAIAQLKEKQSQLRDLGESARNIIPKGSLKRIQENWVKKNLLK